MQHYYIQLIFLVAAAAQNIWLLLNYIQVEDANIERYQSDISQIKTRNWALPPFDKKQARRHKDGKGAAFSCGVAEEVGMTGLHSSQQTNQRYHNSIFSDKACTVHLQDSIYSALSSNGY